MTPEHAKAILPFIAAYAEGKRIQVLCDGQWCEAPNPEFQASQDRYRILDINEVFVLWQDTFPPAVFATREKAIECASVYVPWQVVKYIRSHENETRR